MYTSPREVEITKHADLIHQAYSTAFKERYKTEPFTETEDLPVFAFLSKNFGLEKGSEIARHYVAMHDDWFLKQAHSPNCLRKNIQRVIADHGVKSSRGKDQHIRIKTWLACDKCFKHFDWIGDAHDLQRPSYTRLCEACSTTESTLPIG